MKKDILKHLLYFVLLYAAAFFLFPILDGDDVLPYFDKYYWLEVLIPLAAVYPAVIYFKDINPRTFYFCIDVFTVTVVTLLLFFAPITIFVLASESESLAAKMLIAAVGIFLILFAIYVFWLRGVAEYRNGKIRIFKFKVKTFENGKIEKINFDYTKRECIITITVDGDSTVFKIGKSSGKLCEKRFREGFPSKFQ